VCYGRGGLEPTVTDAHVVLSRIPSKLLPRPRIGRRVADRRPKLEAALGFARWLPVNSVSFQAPVLMPGKIVAAAANYVAHRDEMKAISRRVASDSPAWLSNFDVFLKAPTSIVGPGDTVLLPRRPVAEGKEIHHESELALVIGQGGSSIPENRALGMCSATRSAST
jgi:2-keto-4-pentenoate hydratase/2-oxohepta-3-ene-1,7-dioic acid hydratase in catechol pathway